jgi:hypothetical protein
MPKNFNKLPRSRADEVLNSKDILFAAELRGIRPIEIKALTVKYNPKREDYRK